jgi:hypothetical protein
VDNSISGHCKIPN